MIVIIDYDVGNLQSLQQGFSRANMETIISNDSDIIQQADVLILPGVGAFPDAMKDLKQTGLIPIIDQHVANGKLLVGICLGMQLLFEASEEFTYTEGLGYIDGTVKALNIPYKVPHMGWNDLTVIKEDPITCTISNGDYVYFIHSYYVNTSLENVIAYTNYGVDIPAIVRKKNIIGMQFHPEKSGRVGLRLLQAIKEMIR
ncbi:imidazole glycerol phosphate synthase subunit HisH [Candidatus Xianfuyuplasma coldseepsis]|uniref:Imidazole glycerol phosphate synthase subunit HisH n=1 Tax=Candidatus Xianfuyuplasma coldseepsis TaxID=2782163 RepID=A0A7L7KPY8_9MOLU|nr:imidazole glycerol phosphate synthase subunit HisH [Xianfuyuplasma coldseepsis]QMS84783.1 imidazole glycerol phosphate synthase subunit HisH [Xianfuyuplasma coldseepsis]